MRILQITPRYFPSVCGVGDYSRILGDCLNRDFGLASEFLIADPVPGFTPHIENLPVQHPLVSRHPRSLVEAIQCLKPEVDAIVLQASFYGYDRHGLPFWLQRGLSRLRHVSQVPVLTMFHELFASGPVGSRAFWYGTLQRWLVRRVANTSSAVRTNRETSQAWLASSTRHQASDIPTFPVFSNLGEMTGAGASLQARRPLVVAPGVQPDSEAWPDLVRCAKRIGCSEIALTGPGVDPSRSLFHTEDITVSSLGKLDATAYASLLSTARAGFLDYNPLFLGKSGHFAAFAAHGVVPIVRRAGQSSLPDGLVNGRHYLCGPEEYPVSDSDLEGLQSTLLHWYTAHNVKETARSYAEQIERLCSRRARP